MRSAETMRRRNRPAGFTLLEVLVALSIFAVGMLAVAGMQVEAIKGNTLSDLMTVGTTLAEAKMEQLLTLADTHQDLRDNNPANNANLLGALGTGGMTGAGDWDGHQETNLDRRGLTLAQGGTAPFMFNRLWNVANNSPGAGFTTVVVVVRWADQQGSHRVYASTVRQ